MKTIRILKGNPIITHESDSEREKLNQIMACADKNHALDICILDVRALKMSNNSGASKTLLYPDKADLSWVLRKIANFSLILSKARITAFSRRAEDIFRGTVCPYISQGGVIERNNDTCKIIVYDDGGRIVQEVSFKALTPELDEELIRVYDQFAHIRERKQKKRGTVSV